VVLERNILSLDVGVSAGRAVDSSQVAVHVVPAALLAYEAACLVQTRGPAAQFAASYKLHRGMAGVLDPMSADFQSQPTQARWMRFQLGGAGARVPSVEQVTSQVAHVGAVARTHEFLSIRCLQVERAGVVATAAVCIGACTPAVTVHVGILKEDVPSLDEAGVKASTPTASTGSLSKPGLVR